MKNGDVKALFHEINERHPIVETAIECGVDVHKNGSDIRSKSIYDPGNNETCTVYYPESNKFFDFKAQRGGDVVDLVAQLKFNGDNGRAINELTGGNAYKQGQYQRQMNELQRKIFQYHAALRPEDKRYLHQRGLGDTYIHYLKIGYDARTQRLIIPYIENGRFVYYCSRDASGRSAEELKAAGIPKYMKAPINGVHKHIIWGLHTLNRQKPLVIAEGAFDAMSFDIMGYRVLSSITGTSHLDTKIITEIAKNESAIYITFDNDSAGGGFFKRLAMQLMNNHIFNFKKLNLPARFKDISEYYASGGNLEALIQNASDGVIAFIETFAPSAEERAEQREKRHSEFKEFLLRVGRWLGKAKVAYITDELLRRAYFSSAWIESVAAEATTAPNEASIVENIKAEHEIIYKDEAGFYEYDGMIWRHKSDSEIGALIDNELGDFYSTGRRISSIRSLLQVRTVKAVPFNQNDILVFLNGTLNIKSGIICPHRYSDMSTILLNYRYVKDTNCPRWLNFLRDVTHKPDMGEIDKAGILRMQVLQEFAGYLLYPDCCLQKALFLLGSGNNGKSVFLDVLKAVFGEENIASIEIDGLNKPFFAVGLIDKLANFTTEAGLNFGGAESRFKRLVSGEPITDSYKGRDNFEFRPRAKFIIAANGIPRGRDKSYGFNRRFLFVNFQNKFVDGVPRSDKLERKKDINLIGELLKERTGIFNWAYEGYLRLKRNGKFTHCPDQDTIMGDFIVANNPLYEFIEEEIADYSGTFTREELYNNYKSWCETTGHAKMARGRAFFSEFRAACDKKNIDYKEHKNANDKRSFSFTRDFTAQ